MGKLRNFFGNSYVQEGIIFCAMFVLTMLHEWILIDSVISFIKGMVFFMLLYGQAQLHRFVIFPLFVARRIPAYLLLTILTTMLGAALLYAANHLWLQPECYGDESILLGFANNFVICLISTITILSISLMRNYSIELQRRSQEQLLFNEMQIKLLSSQLNPHFFFNMLNNLYGVSLAEPSRAPGLIVKLSELMRYQIENVKKQSVSLAEEIGFIQNYIDLERERIGKRCDIVFEAPSDPYQLGQFEIAPLMLVILVENAFKHSITDGSWFVHIIMRLSGNELTVNIRNSFPGRSPASASTGVGLENLRKRLELLYPGKHSLVSTTQGQSYEVSLYVKLKTANNG